MPNLSLGNKDPPDIDALKAVLRILFLESQTIEDELMNAARQFQDDEERSILESGNEVSAFWRRLLNGAAILPPAHVAADLSPKINELVRPGLLALREQAATYPEGEERDGFVREEVRKRVRDALPKAFEAVRAEHAAKNADSLAWARRLTKTAQDFVNRNAGHTATDESDRIVLRDRLADGVFDDRQWWNERERYTEEETQSIADGAPLDSVFLRQWPTVLSAWQCANAAKAGTRTSLWELRENSAVKENERRVASLLESATRELMEQPDFVRATEGKSGDELRDAVRTFLASRARNPESQDLFEKAHALKPFDAYRAARLVARVLWIEHVRAEFERECRRKDSAGVIAPVLTSLVSVSQRGAQVELFEDKARILDKRGRVVGEVRSGPTIDGRMFTLSAMGTLAAQRLLRFAVWEGYAKRYIREEPNFAELWIDGGWQALARTFGQTAGKATKEIREAAYALDAISIDTPRGMGRIFAVHEHKPGPGRPSRIEIHLLGPLRPGYVTEELAAHRIAENRRIVPVPMPSKLPPMVGREQDWASQAQMQLLALRELRTGAEELATYGFVEISEKRWREIAEEASVPLRILADVLNIFVAGGEDSPAFLARPRSWAFSLADAYEAEREAIVSAGATATRGRAAGRRGAAKKATGRFGGKKKRQD